MKFRFNTLIPLFALVFGAVAFANEKDLPSSKPSYLDGIQFGNDPWAEVQKNDAQLREEARTIVSEWGLTDYLKHHEVQPEEGMDVYESLVVQGSLAEDEDWIVKGPTHPIYERMVMLLAKVGKRGKDPALSQYKELPQPVAAARLGLLRLATVAFADAIADKITAYMVLTERPVSLGRVEDQETLNTEMNQVWKLIQAAGQMIEQTENPKIRGALTEVLVDRFLTDAKGLDTGEQARFKHYLIGQFWRIARGQFEPSQLSFFQEHLWRSGGLMPKMFKEAVALRDQLPLGQLGVDQAKNFEVLASRAKEQAGYALEKLQYLNSKWSESPLGSAMEQYEIETMIPKTPIAE